MRKASPIIKRYYCLKSNNNNYLNNSWLLSNIISSITYVYYKAYYVESRTGISFTILLKVRKILMLKLDNNSYYYNNLLISNIIRSDNYVSYIIYYVEYRAGTLFTI